MMTMAILMHKIYENMGTWSWNIMKCHETVDLGVTYFQSAHRGRLFLVLLRSAGASHHFSEEGIHWWTPTRGFLSHGGYHQIIQNLTILILKPFETIWNLWFWGAPHFKKPPTHQRFGHCARKYPLIVCRIHRQSVRSIDNPWIDPWIDP